MIQEKLIGQLRPSSTGAEVVYTVPSNTTSIIKSIFLSNTSNSAVEYSIFVSTGTTYDETTALYFEISLAKNTSDNINTYIALEQGNVAIKINSANDATITLFGAEIT